MASFLMHLYVGKFCKDRCKRITSAPQFYLGCINPDCVNAFGTAPKEVRWAAHLRASDTNEWIENNKAFYRDNTGKIDESLLLGFVIHNITDAAYDKHFNKSIPREDWQRFGQEQSKKSWWTHEVLPALKLARPVEINGNSPEHMQKWLASRTDGSRFDDFDDKPRHLTMEIMNELSEIVYKIITGFVPG